MPRPLKHALIVSLSRSGGKLLRMLLDGHPQVNVFPFEHWNRRSKNTFSMRVVESFPSLPVEARLEAVGAAHVERKLLRVHPRPLVSDVMATWRREIAGVESLADAYQTLAHAYFGLIGRSPDAVVVNHCGSLCRFTRTEVDALYGKGRHLLTIRDPRAVFSSMQGLLYRKFTLERVRSRRIPASVLERHVERLETVDSVSGYLREFCEDYRKMVAEYASNPDVIRIRFEDLVISPAETMESLAQALDIGWDPALLQPTQLGGERRPNSSFARRGSSIHDRAADDWIGRLAPAARSHIETALAAEMEALGYRRLDGAGGNILNRASLLTKN